MPCCTELRTKAPSQRDGTLANSERDPAKRKQKLLWLVNGGPALKLLVILSEDQMSGNQTCTEYVCYLAEEVPVRVMLQDVPLHS